MFSKLLLFSSVLGGALAAHISVPLSHTVPYVAQVSNSNRHLSRVEQLASNTSSFSTVDITGNIAFITSDLQIGGSTFRVLLDTGSALLAVPTTGCSQCDNDAPNPAYNPGSGNDLAASECSSANGCVFNVQYADGTALSGQLYRDTVTWGELSTTAVFGGITTESSGFVAPYADGILGLSQDGQGITCSPNCVPTLFDDYVAAGQTQNLFSIYLSNSGDGQLHLGGIDSSFVQGSILYTPVLGNSFYQITLNSVQVDGNTVASGLSSYTTILDSGTTYTVLPNAVYNRIVSNIQDNYCSLTGACGAQTIFSNNCLRYRSDAMAYPDISFSLDGVSFTVPPSSYFIEVQTNDGSDVYCFGIRGEDTDTAILGYSSQRGQYIVYDRENSQVGFAQGTIASATSGQQDSAASSAVATSALYVSLALVGAFFTL